MPCRNLYTEKHDDDLVRMKEADVDDAISAIRKPKEKKSKEKEEDSFDVKGALCDVLTLLKNKGDDLIEDVDTETIIWWNRHKDEEIHILKEKALKKLTEREKEALGLIHKK